MHVLFLPSWYSTVDKPWRGTYIRDQALALARSGVEVGLAFVERMTQMLERQFDEAKIRETIHRRFGYEAVSSRLEQIYVSTIAKERDVA